jgi:hypothetical protein
MLTLLSRKARLATFAQRLRRWHTQLLPHNLKPVMFSLSASLEQKQPSSSDDQPPHHLSSHSEPQTPNTPPDSSEFVASSSLHHDAAHLAPTSLTLIGRTFSGGATLAPVAGAGASSLLTALGSEESEYSGRIPVEETLLKLTPRR